MIIVCYLFVLSYFDQLQMGTDMNLDDLSCTLDYSAEGSCLFFFFGGIPARSTPPTNTCKLTLYHALLSPFLCRQWLKRKPSGSLLHRQGQSYTMYFYLHLAALQE